MNMALKSSYFISIDAAMDPNLLRFPEVVLEKLEVKMEEEETDAEDFLVEKSEIHAFPADNFPDSVDGVRREDVLKDELIPCPANNEEAPEERVGTARRGGGRATGPTEQGRRPGGELYVLRADGNREKTRGRGMGKGHREAFSIHGRPVVSAERGRLRGTHVSIQDWSARLRTCRRRSRGRGARRQHWVQRPRDGPEERASVCVDEERLRGHRFTEDENEALVEGVLRRYQDLCGHSSVRGSSLRKRCFWQEIVNEVNSRGSIFRTVEVCKKRFADCRRVVKAKMAALEQQALGNGDPHEEIRFNAWEELLRHKISMVAGHGMDGMMDACETSSFHSTALWSSPAAPLPGETANMATAWSGIIDTAVAELEPGPISDSEEATSPLNHLLGEWPDEDTVSPSSCVKTEVLESVCDTSPAPFPNHPMSWTMNNPPETPDGREYLRIQEDSNKRLRQLNRTRNIELHKLRGNVVQGSSSITSHLECLTREVRELSSHVRHMHMNQTHFNLMFQNYLSDTRQFYGSIVQALQNLHQAPTVSPMASPASSPAPSPKPQVVTPSPASPLMTSSSLSACAEAASASSTASETAVLPTRQHGQKAATNTQSPGKC